MEYLRLIPGFRTALADGVLVPDSPKHMTTEEFYHAMPGSKVYLVDKAFLFAVAIFSPKREEKYIYTYDYQPEENWTTYTKNVTPEGYIAEEYIFEEECFFRVCIKRADGDDISEEEKQRAEKIICFDSVDVPHISKIDFTAEVNDTVCKINNSQNTNIMKLCLLTDTHYTINGTWEDTAYCIKKVSEKVAYDGMIHLGDLTDGMLSKYMTCKYVNRVIGDLEKTGVPIWITPGNHDSNYFRNEKNMFSLQEMRELYRLGGKNTEGLDYYVDVPEYKVRMIFLSSFNHKAPIRYGYEEQQLVWLETVLSSTPKGSRLLIFSHDAPMAKLDYWSFYVRNGETLLDILEKYNAMNEYHILGFFYGHTHADYVWEECSFPVISVSCSKLEYFTDKKPKGAKTWYREAGKINQELWDSLMIDFETQELRLVRFGAGEDRKVSFQKKKSTYKENLKRERKNRKTKIWAHRGASGHAPENTMPAFELAHTLGADGIELDVQLTKDGIPVVIHDETIDRVCDGKGRVCDYTLEELKQFNANKNFPAYGKVEIPTLEEVYDYVKTTDMSINLELKNSVIFYKNLEEKVLQLAAEKGLEERIIYSSFNHHSMKKMKELKPDVRTAFLYSDDILDVADYAGKYGMNAVHPYMRNLQYPEMIEECHKRNIKVNVWTVNETADIKRMKNLGVDAVITNYPERG